MQTTGPDLFSWATQTKKRAKKPPRQHGFLRALSLVVEYGRRAEETRRGPPPRPATASCPRCGHCGPIARDFGTRRVNGEVRAQSWCRSCRAETSQARRARSDVRVLELDFGSAA